MVWSECGLYPFKPTGNTHSWPVRYGYFMFYFVAFKENRFAAVGNDLLHGLTLMVHPQLPAILRCPVIVKITDEREFAFVIGLKLVFVAFVKTTFVIQRIMKLISVDAGIAGTVQVVDKTFYMIEKFLLMVVGRAAVEPAYPVATELLLGIGYGMVANACPAHVAPV